MLAPKPRSGREQSIGKRTKSEYDSGKAAVLPTAWFRPGMSGQEDQSLLVSPWFGTAFAVLWYIRVKETHPREEA